MTPLFQPIESLQTGECRGFEALARITEGDQLVGPHAFLEALDADDRLCLFGAMLGESIALIKRYPEAMSGLYVSINVEVSLLVDDAFVDVLHYYLDRYGFAGERLVLEILESEEVSDYARLQASLEGVQRLGLMLALDDIGSGYASLAKARDLPIDILKLDRSFSRDIEMHPQDLIFVLMMLSLAHGLGKRLVVEGIESAEVYDALRVMGVELGQGYHIAPPLAEHEIGPWLARRVPLRPNRVPRCLLGAYASHLTVVETCRNLRRQPLPIAWSAAARDPHACVIGNLFTERGWHDTDFGHAHKHFHSVLSLFETDEAVWQAAAEGFRDAMKEAISAAPQDVRCVRLPTPNSERPGGAPPTKRRVAVA